MVKTVFQLLSEAIKEKKQIEFEYQNPNKPDQLGKRRGKPHCVYISNNEKLEYPKQVDLIQISGSGTNNPDLIKRYMLDYITNIRILDTSFEVHSSYNSTAPRYKKILVDINENAIS